MSHEIVRVEHALERGLRYKIDALVGQARRYLLGRGIAKLGEVAVWMTASRSASESFCRGEL